MSLPEVILSRAVPIKLGGTGLTTVGASGSVLTSDGKQAYWTNAVSALTTVTQRSWYIDPLNSTGLASDSNDGATATTPLLTDTRRQNLWEQGGKIPYLTGGIYNIYYLSNLLAPAFARLRGIQDSTATLLVHGSATPGKGNTTLFGPSTIQNRVVAVPASNTRPTITDATVPTGTWAGAGLIGSAASPNKRIRITSGANAGAYAWTMKDGGAGIVNTSTWCNPGTSGITAPFTALATLPSVAIGDPYVVESLTQIDMFSDEIYTIDNGTVNTQGSSKCYESLYLVKFFAPYGTQQAVFNGCCGFGNQQNVSQSSFMQGCAYTTGIINAPCLNSYIACAGWATLSPQTGARANIDGDTMSQGVAVSISRRGGYVRAGSMCAFDSTGDGCTVEMDGSIKNENINFGVHRLWGSGNTGPGLRVKSGAKFAYAATVPTIAGASDFSLAGATVARAWNNATGAFTEAGGVATRVTSWANQVAAIGGGGFGGQSIDPANGASVFIIA